ncbi:MULTISPECIES: hypothetical protein [unclassified Actinopolyspora]|uniref:hypothetical protein n=1 Tax=unclassified Actinopolyspora TaxID=2639451 RepID=UPI0013F62840|nr:MULTISPECIES: hypothetical protein [unclassified Actinopolyspora]NHD18555.1 hypothetical protein [Actinopolyspora sp. BKK2]NHE77486.1 hypothetical protein [Actinopolyspora sp. BKK1]
MATQQKQEIWKACETLDQLDRMPEGAAESLQALLRRVRGIELTEETVQPWRDVVEAGNALDPSSAADAVGLIRAAEAAPTTPLPPKGWLFTDLAILDFARAVNAAVSEPVEVA